MDIEDTGPSFLRAALRLFAIALPSYLIVRLGGKWLFSHSSAEYFSWVRAEWAAELIVCTIASTIMAAGGGYREWKNYGSKQGDRYEW